MATPTSNKSPTHYAAGKDRLQFKSDTTYSAELAPKWDFSKLPLDDQLLRAALLWDLDRQCPGAFTPLYNSSDIDSACFEVLKDHWDYVNHLKMALQNSDDLLWFVLLVRASLLSNYQLLFEAESNYSVPWGLLDLAPSTHINFLLSDFST